MNLDVSTTGSFVARLPPGPTGLPFLGIADRLDPKKQINLMLEYKEKYGDIFSFTLPAQYVVVVSTESSLLGYTFQSGGLIENPTGATLPAQCHT